MSEQLPQLLMRRPHLRDLPPVQTPAGYAVRHFRRGDERGWNRLMDLAFERGRGRSSFEREMAADTAYRPERVQLVVHEGSGAVVATASAWQDARYGEEAVVLHWVAAHPDHGGRGLGTQVSLAALHRGVAEGRSRSFLLTDDFRTAALKTYLRLGFEPVITHVSHPERWRMILRSLSWPERFDAVLAGPRESFQPPR